MGYENLKPALERIQMVTGFLAAQGQDVKTVFALEDHYRDTPQMEAAVERMKADPAVGHLISEGYATPDYDLDELIKHPPGSLGHTYARLMGLHGFKSHFYPDRDIKSDADYCIMRVRKTHDLHHSDHRTLHGRRRDGAHAGRRRLSLLCICHPISPKCSTERDMRFNLPGAFSIHLHGCRNSTFDNFPILGTCGAQVTPD
jgi:hypothetical protein